MLRVLLCCVVVAACGPSRSTFARYPGAPATFDRAASDPKAVEIAEAVFTACGGPTNWDKAKQVKWTQTITADGKVTMSGEEAWDRWNSRHYGRLHRTDGSDVIVGYDLYGSSAIGFVEQKTDHGFGR